MPIDLARLQPHLSEMAAYLDAQRGMFGRNIRNATELADQHGDGAPFAALKEKIDGHRDVYTWQAPGLLDDPLTASIPTPPRPESFTILAVDGSQIDMDRDAPAACYLINIGRASMRYGDHPSARLDSVPYPYYRSEDVVITGRRDHTRERSVDSAIVAARRDTAEARALAEMAEQLPPDMPAIGLLDGSLTQWSPGNEPEVREALLEEYLDALSRLQRVSEQREFAVASYISMPRAREAVNTLRIAACPYDEPRCRTYCRDLSEPDRPCDMVARVRDRDLFDALLREPGHRSAVFESRRRETEEYGAHATHFFYQRAPRELARVEIPRWSLPRVGLIQTLLWDQLDLGDGYPVALAEAHEQAIVRNPDRELFWQMVQSTLSNGQVAPAPSEKATAKRRRAL